MALLTAQQRSEMLANGAARARGDAADPLPVVKLHTLDAHATWLLTELADDGDTAYGLIDAAAAVSAEVAAVDENPLGSIAEWITLHRRADAPDVVSTLAAARPALGREPTSTAIGMLTSSLAALGPVIPALVIIGATLGALATLAAGGVLRFVTRTRSE